MDLQNLVISVGLFVCIYFFFKKFNLLVDNVSYSDHKKLGTSNNSPVIIGGIYLAVIILICLPNNYFFIKIISILILSLGLLSDKNLLPNPKIRIVLQILILLIFINFENLSINNLSFNFIDNLLKNNFFNIILTVFCFATLLNGSNFLDGLNGLLSGYYILVLLSLIYIDSNSNNVEILDIEFAKLLLVALVIFYFFNIFGIAYLGDGGSYLISLLVGFILIKANQNNIFISPYYVAAMLWYPAFENLFSLIRRIYKKSNVSYADKIHLHQLIFRYLKTNKIFTSNLINPITALIILLFNLPSFLISSVIFSHTISLIFLLLINLIIYLSAYYFLSKNFKFKK